MWKSEKNWNRRLESIDQLICHVMPDSTTWFCGKDEEYRGKHEKGFLYVYKTCSGHDNRDLVSTTWKLLVILLASKADANVSARIYRNCENWLCWSDVLWVLNSIGKLKKDKLTICMWKAGVKLFLEFALSSMWYETVIKIDLNASVVCSNKTISCDTQLHNIIETDIKKLGESCCWFFWGLFISLVPKFSKCVSVVFLNDFCHKF